MPEAAKKINLKHTTMKTKDELIAAYISEYTEKIKICDQAIEAIKNMLHDARKDDTIDIEDLREERRNCQIERQHYVQFVKKLEDLQ